MIRIQCLILLQKETNFIAWRMRPSVYLTKNIPNVFHVLALHYTKTLITNRCTKRVLSSIVTHSYMFRPCWVIFRENFFVIVKLRLHIIVEWECAVDCVLRCFWRRELSAVPACTAHAGPDPIEFTPPVHSTQSTAHSHSTIMCNLSLTP
jgi:hypothetical protein